jgi:acetyl esterase
MLHPQIKTVLAAMAAANLRPFEAMTPTEAREQVEANARANKAERPVLDGGISDRSIPGSLGAIGIRIYRPSNQPNLPVIVYYHGGGHVVGSLDTHDRTSRNICVGTRAVVVSVDYRLAPEHKFPAAVVDGFDALAWVYRNAAELGVDASRIGVAGDSAGANVAAVAAIMARDAGAPNLTLQSLVYPVVDYSLTDASHERFADGYGILTKGAMAWFQRLYLRNAADADDWRASPIKAADLAGVAPAIIIAAECDVLVDEGKRYAAALATAGVPVERHEFTGMIHGFFGMVPAVDDATNAQRKVIEAYRHAFA